MELLPLSFTELLEIVGYFSTATLVLGIIFQFIIIIVRDKQVSLKLIFVIAITQLLAFTATTYLWLKWPMGLRILYGPMLFPAVISEILIIPVVFSFFNYSIFRSRKKQLQ